MCAELKSGRLHACVALQSSSASSASSSASLLAFPALPLPPPAPPRSARAAIEAKLAVLGDNSSGNGALSREQAAQLAGHPAWQRSGFESLERFIFQFLTGGGAGAEGGRAASESVRLKLEVLGAPWGFGLGFRLELAAWGATLPCRAC